MSEKYEGCDCGGQHFSLGARAWCLNCREYCSADCPCDIAALRQQVEDLQAERDAALTRLNTIAEMTRSDGARPSAKFLQDYAARALPVEEPTQMNECATCGEIDGVEGECPRSERPCGHHCNHVWTHDCCDWCGAEFGEDGEYQVGAVVAYMKGGEPHLAWREPVANQELRHHWHVFHGMSFGWRTWNEVQSGENVRFLGMHSERVVVPSPTEDA